MIFDRNRDTSCLRLSRPGAIPVVGEYNMDHIRESEFYQPCQEKLVMAMLNLSRLAPYYYTIFSAIPKKPAPIGTIGVTENTLYYDMEFIAGLEISELTFILIHEVMHLAMQHSIRFGKRKNHQLWNIATDLYINQIICNDFHIRFGEPEARFGRSDTPCAIKTPTFGVFIETIGEELDLAADTPESIYERLLAENEAKNGNPDSPEDTDTPSGNQTDPDSAAQPDTPDSSQTAVTVTYQGKQLTGTLMSDVLSNRESRTADDLQKCIEESKSALQRLETKVQMEEASPGCSQYGSGLTRRYIRFGLSAGVDWRVLLENLCKKRIRKTFILSEPNRDYMNMGITLADRRVVKKGRYLSHIKFAVDVSGSIPQQTLDRILSEIQNIFTRYEMDAELIYWSTEIGGTGSFSDQRELMRIQPSSTGGTDVRCVFDYLSGQIAYGQHSEQDHPKDITAVFIITDGEFFQNYADYNTAFGQKTIWMITGSRGNPVTFDPPFGRVVPVELSQN